MVSTIARLTILQWRWFVPLLPLCPTSPIPDLNRIMSCHVLTWLTHRSMIEPDREVQECYSMCFALFSFSVCSNSRLVRPPGWSGWVGRLNWVGGLLVGSESVPEGTHWTSRARCTRQLILIPCSNFSQGRQSWRAQVLDITNMSGPVQSTQRRLHCWVWHCSFGLWLFVPVIASSCRRLVSCSDRDQ